MFLRTICRRLRARCACVRSFVHRRPATPAPAPAPLPAITPADLWAAKTFVEWSMAHEAASDTEHADSDSTATLVSQVAPVVEYAASPALKTDDVKSAATPTVPEHSDKVSLAGCSGEGKAPIAHRTEPELLRAAIGECLEEECMVRKEIKEALRQLVDSCGHSQEPSEEQYLVFRHTIDPLHRKCQDLMREIWFYQGKLARCAAPASA